MLHGLDPSRGEALAVADPVHLVDDGRRHIARRQEVGVQRVRHPALDRGRGGHQRLADHLTAEDAATAQVGGLTAEEIHLEHFELQLLDESLERRVHGTAF